MKHWGAVLCLAVTWISCWADMPRETRAMLPPMPEPAVAPDPERVVEPSPVIPVPGRPLPPPGEVFQDCLECPSMRVVPPARIGRPAAHSEWAISVAEVTRGQWQAIMGDQAGDCLMCPVTNVSWNGAQVYVQRLSLRTGRLYRLPTEHEWEQACRAGRSARYCGGNGLDALAWHGGNSQGQVQAVRQKRPNSWGLYDMTGNVWEWTQDCWRPKPRRESAPTATSREDNCQMRVLRGGAWDTTDRAFLGASQRIYHARDFRYPSIGFRVVVLGGPGP